MLLQRLADYLGTGSAPADQPHAAADQPLDRRHPARSGEHPRPAPPASPPPAAAAGAPPARPAGPPPRPPPPPRGFWPRAHPPRGRGREDGFPVNSLPPPLTERRRPGSRVPG